MIQDFESVSTNDLCLYLQKRYGHNKKYAYKLAIATRRHRARQKRVLKAKKYADFIKITQNIKGFDIIINQAYFTIKECKLMLRRSKEIINTGKIK